MSDMNQENKDSDNNKKQFYSINLTSERIFAVFIAVLVFIALIVVVVAFSVSQKPTTKKGVASQETIDEIIGSEDFAFDDFTDEDEFIDESEEGIVDDEILGDEAELLGESDELAGDESKTEAELLGETEENTEEEVTQKDSPDVKVDDKVSYSSKYVEKQKPTIVANKPVAKKPTTKPTVTQKKPVKSFESKPVTKQEVKPVAKPKPAKPATTVSGKKWVIQIGSFSTQKSANDVRAFYSGYPSYIREINKDSKKFYRLRLGPYDTEAQAKSILANVKKSKYGKDGYIVIGYF